MRLSVATILVFVFGLLRCSGQLTTGNEIPKEVTFVCRAGKRIDATFHPRDDTRVDLKLSDGRRVSVPRTISGSGARYAIADGNFVFWNKGNTAFITEGSPDQETYSDCVIQQNKTR
jgi:membrane-bound inhibitor of C-type lysozyme